MLHIRYHQLIVMCVLTLSFIMSISGTGVAFSRNPSTGENVMYGEYLINAQGEDVVAGKSFHSQNFSS